MNTTRTTPAVTPPAPRDTRPRAGGTAARRGGALVYGLFAVIGLSALFSLTVDFGRVSGVKGELQQAADAIAMYAASGLSTSITTTQSRATAAAGDNRVDGAAISFDVNTDLEFGAWDSATNTFTVLTGTDRNSATAVRVTLQYTAARGKAVSTPFTRFLGRTTVDITATAIATRGKVVTPTVDADACPWLAGMPTGSKVTAYGGNSTNATAPANSPMLVTQLPIVPGQKLFFRKTEGVTSYMNAGQYTAEGNTGWIVRQNPENGINATSAPLNSLVGIFLDNNAPNTSAMQAELDFTTSASRDFTTLSPQLKQVFFIGDGINSAGKLQEFVIPPGATRLYLGIMDEKAWWWDNTGSINTTMLDGTVMLVR
jgi:Flp pilus assembly protein TadG